MNDRISRRKGRQCDMIHETLLIAAAYSRCCLGSRYAGGGEPLKKIFSKVLRYDFGEGYIKFSVSRTNNEIIDLVRAEPEIPDVALGDVRNPRINFSSYAQRRVFVIDRFSDDECRFDDYPKWWIHYLDYILTNDRESVERYEGLGAAVMQFF